MIALGWLKPNVFQAQLEHWLSPEVRPLLARIKGAADHLPDLEETYQFLLRNQALEDTEAGRALLALMKKAADLDAVHDYFARGEYDILSAWAAFYYDDEEKVARLVALQERLFPEGLSVVNWAYDREAAEMNRVEGALTAPDRTLMATIPTPQGDLAKTHKLRLKATQSLAKVDREIAAQAVAIKADRVSSEDIKANRQRAENIMEAIMASAKVAKLSKKEDALIFDKLREAAKKERANRSKAVAETVHNLGDDETPEA